jgi:hypothetical protein
MNDPLLARTLEALVPPFDDVPADWADAVRRGAARPRAGRALLVAVAAAFALGALASTSLGQGLFGRTLDELGAWVGASPGEPASPEEQQSFEAANARSYTHLPHGTKLGRLLRADVNGVPYDLLGYRDDGQLCLSLVRAGLSDEPGTCASRRLLADLRAPAAVFDAHAALGSLFDGRTDGTAVYGLATDDVTSVRIRFATGDVHPARVANNAFVYSTDDPIYEFAKAATALIVTERGGKTTTIPLRVNPVYPSPTKPSEVPGPDHVDYSLGALHASWLERGEQRGKPYKWPFPWVGAPEGHVIASGLFDPLPNTAFRLGVAYGSGVHDGKPVDWYCFTWLAPLARTVPDNQCNNGAALGLQETGADVANDGSQLTGNFLVRAGIVDDRVASLKLFLPSGVAEQVKLQDNVYAVEAPGSVPVKLIAYDAQGRVVGIRML